MVLLDLVMPNLDGFGFLSALRADVRHRDLPVVVLTAKDLSADERRLLSAHAQEVLGKAATPPSELLGELRRWLHSIRDVRTSSAG